MTKKYRVPSWLDNMAKTEWKRILPLLDSETFEDVDLRLLEAYCQAYAKWKRSESILIKKGYTFTTPNGYVQQRPEVAIANKAYGDMQSSAKELGFTPAARIRMDKNKGDAGRTSEKGSDPEMEDMIN